MADISIPGVTTSKYKTDELIAGLMKVERVPRDRADSDLKSYKKQQDAWRQINQQVTTLRDAVKSLYSYDNPFGEKIAASTNERAITASVTKEALDQSFKVSVSQVATSDSFLSNPIDKNATVAKGNYTFAVGEQKVSFTWKGGSYTDFISALNRRANGLIRGSLVQTTSDTRALLIESLKTGANERLSFSDEALSFALNTGLIKKNDNTAISLSKDSVSVASLSNDIIDFSATARAKDGYVLEYTVTVTDQDATDETKSPQNGPDMGKPGTVTYGGITINNAASETALSEAESQAAEGPITDSNVLSLRSTKGTAIPLPAISDTAGTVTETVSLSEYGDVNAILVHNKNTNRHIQIDNIKIYDPKAAGDYIPVNPVSVAQDTIMKYEGIPITRHTNSIDDLLPGVTLDLHEPTDKIETIKIEPDTKTAKESIISFVADYNRVMAQINILTQTKPEIITEIQYFSEEEKKDAEEKLGMMQGDSTLNTLKNSMQQITSNRYQTDENNSMTILAQMGISTKATAGGGIDTSRLRGYLEIDEKKLDDALANHIEDAKNLFGYDSDEDMIIDTGVAKALDAKLTPYVQTGGIFNTRISGLGDKIDTTEKKIATLDTQLEDKEADLKSKYGQMEGTLNKLQSQSDSISNFTKKNSN